MVADPAPGAVLLVHRVRIELCLAVLEAAARPASEVLTSAGLWMRTGTSRVTMEPMADCCPHLTAYKAVALTFELHRHIGGATGA